ncbi:class I SAM-dependent methyltransferase [Amycolatopsis sulphurea]|uniref:class I SAM-dependent methyltransferase n=1 Tax=Amycolatopsis sulphurea TaxID=76022 RepID=UPI000BF3BA00|nr:class I SAM-dependent methyltransferase [Amycolatopsis sulphurea]
MSQQRQDRFTARNLGPAVRRRAALALRRAATRLDDPYPGRLHELEQELRRMRAELHTEIVRQGDRVLDRVVEFEIRSRRDIVYAGDQDAALQSNVFARENLIGAKHFGHPKETLQYALSLAPRGGMALEFGVASGNTLRTIATARGGIEVYGFDSFDGLPEAWLNGMPAGAFARDDLPEVPGAELVVGLFSDTLGEFLDRHPGPVDFLHVDSDLYSSAKTVLDLVGPRLQVGSIVHFDEFFNFPGWQRHEYRAWLEHVDKTGVSYEYEAYTYNDNQVTVRITGLG